MLKHLNHKKDQSRRAAGCLFLTLAIHIVACSQLNTITKNGKTESKEIQETFLVQGQITQTSEYCGGAAPPQLVLDQLATPVPYPGKKFYIRQGGLNNSNSKIITNFTSGSSGDFAFQLAPGIYSLIVEDQVDTLMIERYTKENQQIDIQCLKDWWKQPLLLLDIKNSNVTALKLNFHHRCFIEPDIPCISYHGPPHP